MKPRKGTLLEHEHQKELLPVAGTATALPQLTT